jgi:hypothetical protein
VGKWGEQRAKGGKGDSDETMREKKKQKRDEGDHNDEGKREKIRMIEGGKGSGMGHGRCYKAINWIYF